MDAAAMRRVSHLYTRQTLLSTHLNLIDGYRGFRIRFELLDVLLAAVRRISNKPKPRRIRTY